MPSRFTPPVSRVSVPRSAGLLAITLLLLPTVLHAQVYRSVDEAGNVTFSDNPPEGAVEVAPVEIPPGPPADQVREAQERAEANRLQLDQLRSEREAEEAKRREERLRRLEEQALRNAARPQSPPASADGDPDARAWWRYYGQPVVPSPRPPIDRPRPRPPGGDHPAYRPRPMPYAR